MRTKQEILEAFDKLAADMRQGLVAWYDDLHNAPSNTIEMKTTADGPIRLQVTATADVVPVDIKDKCSFCEAKPTVHVTPSIQYNGMELAWLNLCGEHEGYLKAEELKFGGIATRVAEAAPVG